MTARPVTLAIAAILLPLTGCASTGGSWQLVQPFGKKEDVVVARDGVALRLVPPTLPDEDDLDQDTEIPRIALFAEFPGLPRFGVPTLENVGDTYGYSVRIGRLAAGDPSPAILIAGYTGGMHCCHTMQVVSLVDGKPAVAVLPLRDGEEETSFPRDLDGDGTVDLVRPDGRFNYAFTAYAFSIAPPRYFNIVRGAARDVSSAPRYAPLYRSFADEMGDKCASGEPGRNGACVAHAAAMARLGETEAGIAYAVRHAAKIDWYPDSCTVPLADDDACPSGKEREFASFEEALRWFLADTGWSGP